MSRGFGALPGWSSVAGQQLKWWRSWVSLLLSACGAELSSMWICLRRCPRLQGLGWAGWWGGEEPLYCVRVTTSTATSSRSEKTFFKHRLIIWAERVTDKAHGAQQSLTTKVNFIFWNRRYDAASFVPLVPRLIWFCPVLIFTIFFPYQLGESCISYFSKGIGKEIIEKKDEPI